LKTQTEHTIAPYSKLAAFYDGMMEHVDYEHWADYIDQILRKIGKKIKNVCELACGTGTLAVALSKRGYQMTCSDVSNDMVRQAIKKAGHANLSIDFSVCNMLEFTSKEPFDAVLCLYDSINYLDSEDEVIRFFSNTSLLLKDGGIFIFDACTEKNSLEHFDQRYEFDRAHRYRRRSYYIRKQKVQVNEITLEVDGKFYTERHNQKIFTIKELTQMIRDSDFTLEHLFADLTFNKGSENSERVHFVLRNKSTH
jgi:2-polyprenyl-3-methyl-5-hydroxy-6-metoxy-1,4-benzoquinol methylase